MLAVPLRWHNLIHFETFPVFFDFCFCSFRSRHFSVNAKAKHVDSFFLEIKRLLVFRKLCLKKKTTSFTFESQFLDTLQGVRWQMIKTSVEQLNFVSPNAIDFDLLWLWLLMMLLWVRARPGSVPVLHCTLTARLHMGRAKGNVCTEITKPRFVGFFY